MNKRLPHSALKDPVDGPHSLTERWGPAKPPGVGVWGGGAELPLNSEGEGKAEEELRVSRYKGKTAAPGSRHKHMNLQFSLFIRTFRGLAARKPDAVPELGVQQWTGQRIFPNKRPSCTFLCHTLSVKWVSYLPHRPGGLETT